MLGYHRASTNRVKRRYLLLLADWQPLCRTLSDALVRAKRGPLSSMQNDFLLHAHPPADERRELTARRGTRTQWSLRHGRAREPGFPSVGVGAAVVLGQAVRRSQVFSGQTAMSWVMPTLARRALTSTGRGRWMRISDAPPSACSMASSRSRLILSDALFTVDQAASRQPSGVSSKVSLGASSRSASARRSTISSTDGLPETFSR